MATWMNPEGRTPHGLLSEHLVPSRWRYLGPSGGGVLLEEVGCWGRVLGFAAQPSFLSLPDLPRCEEAGAPGSCHDGLRLLKPEPEATVLPLNCFSQVFWDDKQEVMGAGRWRRGGRTRTTPETSGSGVGEHWVTVPGPPAQCWISTQSSVYTMYAFLSGCCTLMEFIRKYLWGPAMFKLGLTLDVYRLRKEPVLAIYLPQIPAGSLRKEPSCLYLETGSSLSLCSP